MYLSYHIICIQVFKFSIYSLGSLHPFGVPRLVKRNKVLKCFQGLARRAYPELWGVSGPFGVPRSVKQNKV